VRRAQGDLAGALKAFQDSLDIRQALAAADPGDAEARRDLSVSFNSIGDVRRAQGDLAGALKAFQDSFDIAQALAAADPGNAEARRDLAISYSDLAALHRDRSAPQDEIEALEAGRAILIGLLEQFADHPQWRADLAWFEVRLGERKD